MEMQCPVVQPNKGRKFVVTASREIKTSRRVIRPGDHLLVDPDLAPTAGKVVALEHGLELWNGQPDVKGVVVALWSDDVSCDVDVADMAVWCPVLEIRTPDGGSTFEVVGDPVPKKDAWKIAEDAADKRDDIVSVIVRIVPDDELKAMRAKCALLSASLAQAEARLDVVESEGGEL